VLPPSSRLHYAEYGSDKPGNSTESTGATGSIRESQKAASSNDDTHKQLNIRYHGEWYDMTRWRTAHPAGTHWIDWFDQRDGTDIIDGLHDPKARMMLKRLPKTDAATAAVLEAKTPADTDIQIAFRKLYDKLHAEGWWERDMGFEYRHLGIYATLVGGAIATAHNLPQISFILLALSFTGAGWLSHDYIHGLDPFARRLRSFLAYTAGLCPRWWSDKHNKHHAMTNEMGVDEDMASDPVLFTWAPDPSQDSPLRKIQHYIFYVPFSILFFLWRVDSVTVAIKSFRQKRPHAKSELRGLIIHYMLLFALFPVRVIIPAVFLSGLITALVVTSTHQSEEKFTEYVSDYVERQFRCTRSVRMTNPFSAWIWGGMQYQIEHHLFPSIPRSRLPALQKILKKFAKDHDVKGGYRESGELEILKMNWETYRRVANEGAVEGAPLTRGRNGQQGAILPPEDKGKS